MNKLCNRCSATLGKRRRLGPAIWRCEGWIRMLAKHFEAKTAMPVSEAAQIAITPLWLIVVICLRLKRHYFWSGKRSSNEGRLRRFGCPPWQAMAADVSLITLGHLPRGEVSTPFAELMNCWVAACGAATKLHADTVARRQSTFCIFIRVENITGARTPFANSFVNHPLNE